MKQKRVLVVDDEEDLTWSISKHLAKDKDKYQLIAVNNGRAALEALSQFPVDLVISDIRMPEISGLDLLLKIRESYPHTKVIIMTAYGSSDVQDEANKRGCFKYIEKPFDFQELRQLIQNAIEEKKGFEGRISDFQLSDLIQMNCLGRLTNALQVQKHVQKGVIYFEDGNIVHASLDDHEGEEAFYEILSWEGGSFSVEKGARSPKESVFKGWQTLLLEGLRRADERRNSDAEALENEGKQKQDLLTDILSDFLKVRGVILAAIIDAEGTPTASMVKPEFKEHYEISQTAPFIASLQKQGEKTAQDLKNTNMKEMVIEFDEDQGLLFLSRIADSGDYLAALTDGSLNLSLLRMESKKLMKRLTEI